MFTLASVSKSSIYSGLLILSLSVLTAAIILFASPKITLVFSLLLALIIFYLLAPDFAKIVIPIILITFPVTLQILGKDAFSTGTLFIFATFTWAMAKFKLSVTVGRDKLVFALLLLIALIALAGMVTKTPAAYWGPAFRHYIDLISSLSFFVLIIHAQNISGIAENERDYIEKVISALLLITVVHIILSLIIFNFPWIEEYFSIFLRRTQEHFGDHIRKGVYTRAASVFTGGEQFGELLILLFPFALYKIFVSKKKLYLFLIPILMFGTIISGTRSALFLIIFQILAFIYILVPQTYNTQKYKVTGAIVLIGILTFPIFFKYSYILVERVQETYSLIKTDADIVTVLNRSSVWPKAYALTIRTISFFGHGPTQAIRLGFPVSNFHNLYMSIIFQFGVIGSITFFTFFFVLIKRLLLTLKRDNQKGPFYLLTGTCLLSLCCFLINEIKFEFNRSDSYQQIVWGIFAIFYLSGRLWRSNKK